MQKILGGENFSIIEKSLDALWLRQRIISNNIANIDTPGYKSKTVVFEELLKNAIGEMGASNKNLNQRISSLEPQIRQNESTSKREDGNNVDIDAENIELVRTQIQYEYLTKLLNSEISRMKYILTEGRG